jgi:hypothetical protein
VVARTPLERLRQADGELSTGIVVDIWICILDLQGLFGSRDQAGQPGESVVGLEFGDSLIDAGAEGVAGRCPGSSRWLKYWRAAYRHGVR